MNNKTYRHEIYPLYFIIKIFISLNLSEQMIMSIHIKISFRIITTIILKKNDIIYLIKSNTILIKKWKKKKATQ